MGQRNTTQTLVAGGAAALAAVASAAGVFLRGDLATAAFTTFRGEKADVLTAGVYRYNDVSIASEGVGWDIVTLFIVVPALLLTLPAVWRGTLRGRLLATGLLAYLLYQYAEYAMALAYGPLFLVYVGAFSLSISAIALICGSIDLRALPTRFGGSFPRRGVMGLAAFMSLLLTGMWLPLVLRTMTSADTAGMVASGTTMVVQAFDLGFLVPLGIFTFVTIRRRAGAGYLLASVICVKAPTMAAAIASMLIVEAIATGELAIAPIAVFAATAGVSLAIGWRLFRSLDAEPLEAPQPLASRPQAA